MIVATNHSVFRTPQTLARIAELAAPECVIVDPWNCWGAGTLYADSAELRALAGRT